MSIPTEKRLARLAGDGVEIVAESAVATYAADFRILVLPRPTGLRPFRTDPGRRRLRGTGRRDRTIQVWADAISQAVHIDRRVVHREFWSQADSRHGFPKALWTQLVV